MDLEFNVTGQSLSFFAPEGRASSIVESEVHAWDAGDDDTAETATTGAAAVATNPNTTVDAASGAGQSDARQLNVAATTGFERFDAPNRSPWYLATTANGEVDRFEVDEIASADYVRARHPLRNAYASADTVVTTEITHAILDAWIEDESNISDGMWSASGGGWRWRIVYVVGGVTYAHNVPFDVVRYRGQHDVIPRDVRKLASVFGVDLPDYTEESGGATIIDEAYDQLVIDLRMTDVKDQLLRDREVVRDLVKWKTLVLLMMNKRLAGGGNEGGYDLAKGVYEKHLAGLVSIVRNALIATDDSGAASREPAPGFFSR
jgi:hypothetical protein